MFRKKEKFGRTFDADKEEKSKKNDTLNAFNEREECLSFNNDDEEVLNDGVVVERSDDNAKFEKEEERRRRRERSEKKSLVLKRWARNSRKIWFCCDDEAEGEAKITKKKRTKRR